LTPRRFTRDGRSGDLPRRLEPRLEEFEDWTIDGGRTPAIAYRWHRRAGYPDACSRSPPVRC